MSIRVGRPSAGFYGLVVQKGPWPETRVDKTRRGGYQADNTETIRPGEVRSGNPGELSEPAARIVKDRPVMYSNAFVQKPKLTPGRVAGKASQTHIGTQTTGTMSGGAGSGPSGPFSGPAFISTPILDEDTLMIEEGPSAPTGPVLEGIPSAPIQSGEIFDSRSELGSDFPGVSTVTEIDQAEMFDESLPEFSTFPTSITEPEDLEALGIAADEPPPYTEFGEIITTPSTGQELVGEIFQGGVNRFTNAVVNQATRYFGRQLVTVLRNEGPTLGIDGLLNQVLPQWLVQPARTVLRQQRDLSTQIERFTADVVTQAGRGAIDLFAPTPTTSDTPTGTLEFGGMDQPGTLAFRNFLQAVFFLFAAMTPQGRRSVNPAGRLRLE